MKQNLFGKFDKTFSLWEKALHQYSLAQLRMKKDNDSWSIGQVYMHLVAETSDYYIRQVEACLRSNRDQRGKKNKEGHEFFKRMSFPAARLKGPPEQKPPRQPDSVSQIERELKKIRTKMTQLAVRIRESNFKGKTRHPGLDFFNAAEWYQFTEMHLRHHFRQKKRIDTFLRKKPG